MKFHVVIKAVHLRECFRAMIARKWLFASVFEQMSIQNMHIYLFVLHRQELAEYTG